MKLRKTLFLILFALLWELGPLMAQNIIVEGRIVDKETKVPLPFASIFVNNSAEGTLADEGGLFSLEMKEGYQELVLSHPGYENLIFTENFTGEMPNYVFELAPRILNPDEIDEKEEKDLEWFRNLKIFEYHFIGNSKFATDSELLNPEDLLIVFEDPILKVQGTDFLFIENHKLGYLLKYLLSSFEYDIRERKVKYLGYPNFTEMEGGKMKERRWRKNRISAYLGSWLHFIRSVGEERTKEEGFEVRRMKMIPNPDRPNDQVILAAKQRLKKLEDLSNSMLRDSLSAIVKKESLPKNSYKADSILISERDFSSTSDGKITLNFEGFLEVAFIEGKVSEEYLNSFLPGKVPKTPHPVSRLSITSPVIIHSTGVMSNPLALYLEGYWAWQKMGDALPIDYKYPE